MIERSNFFANLVGSISGLSFYASVPGKRHPLVVVHLFVLTLVVLAVILVPFAGRLIRTTDRYVRYYDERLPEIHIVGNRLSFVGPLPAVVQLESGAQIVVDTTGAYVSAEGLPRGSVLLTNRALEVKGEEGVRRYAFDSLHAAAPIIITPENVHALKGQFLAIFIALLVVGGAAVFFVLGLLVVLVGTGYVLLLDALRRGPVRAKDAWALAVYGLTPFTLVLCAVLVAGFFSTSFLVVLWVGYCLLLGLAVIRFHRAVVEHEP